MPRFQKMGLLALAISVTIAPVAQAQDRPVVFIHGLGSSEQTWQSAADALQQQLALEAYRPNVSWSETFQVQAAQVQASLGGLNASPIAVGHSNGGLVSRQWSKAKYLDGLVTLGTPNHGAPLVDNIFHFTQFSFEVYGRLMDIFDAFGECAGVLECANEWSWVLQANDLDKWLASLVNFIIVNPWDVASTLGFMNGYSVLPEMAVQSPFIQDLNANFVSEQTGTRVGIVSVARHWNDAGWWRSHHPESADTVAYVVDYGAMLLDLWAAYLYGTADPDDDRALSMANKMTIASGFMIGLDSIYCRAVSAPKMGPTCRPNDTVVPDLSQQLPGAVSVLMNDGPVHIRETTESSGYIYQVLTNNMSIPPRGSGGSSGTGSGAGATGGGGGGGGNTGGGGGGLMQQDSSITGCSNWWWLDPVYKPDAASCYLHCQLYEADACEWTAKHAGASLPGDCYVEYGDGCTVTSGNSGWSAAVLNLGGPPSGDGGSGGGGIGQMHPDSAVRGCLNWSWWDPVYQPDAEACVAYCIQNNADACEWYQNGECYVEFGDGCRVEAGYPGWSAMVAP